MWIVAIAGLLDRLILVSGFHFRITDVDQLIQWHGALDYARGIFREPFFYGQDYGPMSEAFLSVPLIAVGVKPQYALPIVTLILSMMPFWIIAWTAWKLNSNWSALIALLWPITLDVEYGILINQPRGFVAGIGIGSLAILCMTSPRKNWAITLFSIVAPISVYICPNSALLLVCIGTYLWLHNIKNWKFYLIPCITSMLVALVFTANKQFYVAHPEFMTHTGWNVFNWDWLWAAIRDDDLDRFFRHLFPIIGDAKRYTVISIALLAVIHLRINRKLGLGLVAVSFIIILVLGHSRIHNGLDDDLFYPIARNWYSLPIITALGTAWLFLGRNLRYWHVAVICPIIVFFTWQKSLEIENQFTKNAFDQEYRVVPYHGIEQIRFQCDLLQEKCAENDVDLIVFTYGNTPKTKSPQLYNYGCPILVDNFPKSILESSDRFTWNQSNYGNKTFGNILIYGATSDLIIPKEIQSEVIHDKPKMILIKGITESTFSLLNWLGLNSKPERRAMLMKKETLIE